MLATTLGPPLQELHSVAGRAVGTLFPILTDSALRGMLVLLGAWAAVLLLRRGPASARHAVWAAAILVLGTLPILTRTIPSIALPLPMDWPTRQLDHGPTSVVTDQHRASDARESSVIHPAPSYRGVLELPQGTAATRATPVGAADWLVLAWLIGALVIVSRLLVGMVVVRRSASGPHGGPGSEWLDLLRDVARELGVRRRVALRIARTPAVPITWGIVRPVVLLPNEAQEWSRRRRRAVMLHELAHVARFDALTQVIAQLVLAVNWFNPLAWFAVARLRAERERACDDVVLMHGTRATDYAEELLQLARTLWPAAERGLASLAMAREVELEGRLIAVLDPCRQRTALSVGARLVSLAAAAPFVTLVAAGQPVGRVAPSPAASLRSTSAHVAPPPATGPTTRVPLTPPSHASLQLPIASRSVTLLAPIDTPPVAATTRDTSPVGARIRRGREEALRAVGFTSRRESGTGHFITDEDIAQAQPGHFADLFTNMPGIRVDYSTGYPVLTSSVGGLGGCVSYIIDGVPRQLSDPGDLDALVPLGQVTAIEVYNASEAPADFRTSEQSSCEVIAIWTKAKINGASSSSAPCSQAPTFLQEGTKTNQARINLTYQDSDIRDVLAAFASFSGRTIKVAKDVQGTVTTEVRDQPWDVALQWILASHQLAASEDQYGIITIDNCSTLPAPPRGELPLPAGLWQQRSTHW